MGFGKGWGISIQLRKGWKKKLDIQVEFVKDLDLCKFEIATQDEYLINAGKRSHLFEQLIVSKK